jgi:hypothetical protein
MKILHENPPEWIMTGCLNQFRVNLDHTFWTYGDIIYNPGKGTIPDHIIAHEETHMRQQEAYVKRPEGECIGIEMKCEAHQDQWFEHKLPDGTECAGPGEPLERGKDAWWEEYLANPRFRMEQEAQAYGEQYKFFCKYRKDRNERSRFLNSICDLFSGPLYQLALTKSQARAMIQVLSGEKTLKQVS